MNSDVLSAQLQTIRGVGPKLANTFREKGIETLEDALYFLPRDYEDRRQTMRIADVQAGRAVLIKGKAHKGVLRRGRRARFEVLVTDGTGRMLLTWFHGFPYLEKDFSKEQELTVFGEAKPFSGIMTIVHPEYQFSDLPAEGFGGIVPVYSECEGTSPKMVRKIMREVLKDVAPALEDSLPTSLRSRLGLPTLRESFVGLHSPDDVPAENASPWLKRIIFEEFFVLQLGLGLRRIGKQEVPAPALLDEQGHLPRFLEKLPFSLTEDQSKVLKEVVADLSKNRAMSRLVQGDVGSGKTVVALGAAAVAASAGYQAAIMVPTEILAQQHYQKACEWLRPLGISVGLLVQGADERKEVEANAAAGSLSVIIGTHTLFQQGISFKNLGVAVVDEQHRFGVEQRSRLIRKGNEQSTHLLMMTATPIPRTLALTLYGDLDLSFIRQKPAGRKPIQTLILRDRERPKLFHLIRETVKQRQQVYIIYPLVEESEKLELKSATDMFHQLSKEVFPDFRIALLHGRMKPEDKEAVLASFRVGNVDILVSTTVIEVGIDVPNATLMVIEHPERLGLSQLHQLRGRVGRGEMGGRCVLMASSFVGPRLKIMAKTEDGFEIAEEDMKLRGPGEFLGTRQSGLPGFRVGHLLRDAELLTLAREEARAILERDPKLEESDHFGIRKLVESRWKSKLERLRN